MSDAPLPTPSSTPPEAPHVHAEPRDKPRRLARWRLVVAIILAVLLVAVSALWWRGRTLWGEGWAIAISPARYSKTPRRFFTLQNGVWHEESQGFLWQRDYLFVALVDQSFVVVRRTYEEDEFGGEEGLDWCVYRRQVQVPPGVLIQKGPRARSRNLSELLSPFYSLQLRHSTLFWAVLVLEGYVLWPFISRFVYRRPRPGLCPQCHYDLRGTPAHTAALESNAAERSPTPLDSPPFTAGERPNADHVAPNTIASPTKTCPECGWTGFV